MLYFLSLSKSRVVEKTFGHITVTLTEKTNGDYSISWHSRMTNIKTVFHRRGKNNYVVEKSVGMNYDGDTGYIETFNHVKTCLRYFLSNVDTRRIDFEVVKSGKLEVVNMINSLENVKVTLTLNKPSRVQNVLGLPIKIGENKENDGILLKIFPGEGKAEVKVNRGKGFQIMRLPTNILWV